MSSQNIPNWPFADPQNVAVFTHRGIMSGNLWIHYVSHDEEDGGWQFHPVGFTSMSDAMLVSLREVYKKEPSIAELADLPYGWIATRESKTSAWKRSKAQPQ